MHPLLHFSHRSRIRSDVPFCHDRNRKTRRPRSTPRIVARTNAEEKLLRRHHDAQCEANYARTSPLISGVYESIFTIVEALFF